MTPLEPGFEGKGMRELFARLLQRPGLTVEILAASLFVNVLSLAQPLYVMQLLNRYIGYGFDGTLITLTAGVAIATLLGVGFSAARTRLARAVSAKPDQELSERTLAVLSRAKTQALERIPQAKVQEILAGLGQVRDAYGSRNVVAVLDVPFFLIFLAAVFFLCPVLALVTVGAMVATIAAGLVTLHRQKGAARELQNANAAHRGFVASMVRGADTVRAFAAASFAARVWRATGDKLARRQAKAERTRGASDSMQQAIGAFLRIAVYALGAKQVVDGNLSVGGLIGVSILASRAHQQVASFMQASFVLARTGHVLGSLREFLALPLEPVSGAALRRYSGRLEFKDAAFAYPGSAGPLFESLSLELAPGTIMCVTGGNATGKTTLARLMAGLLEPSRGQILVDGVDLRQVAAEWWRKQIMYMAQEPVFLTATIRENILLANPELEEERLNAILRAVGLRDYLDRTSEGLEAVLFEGGRNLSLGVRRRIALARALAAQGKLAILDEPTEGLDGGGAAAVYGILNSLAKEGTTMAVFTYDPHILKAAHLVLDLNHKPTPRLAKPKAAGAAQ
jgi:ATP-binding cassette subfamily C protein LapB